MHRFVITLLLLAAVALAAQVDIKIAGGERSSLGQFPYTVEIVSQYGDGSAGFCGGTLVNSRFVLTAAHCFLEEARTPQSIIAILGTNNLQSSSRTVITVTHAITHPNYNNETAENDVALVLLSQDVAESSTIQYAFIGTQNPSINTDLIVAGWGLNNNRQTAPPAQQSWATLTVVSGQRCANYFRTFNTQTTLCLFGNDQQPCVGDSGSGLVIRPSGQSRFVVYGLVSFGTDSCAAADSLNGFTSIQHYYDFITFNGNPSGTLPTASVDGRPLIISGTIPSSAVPTNAGQIIGIPVDQTPPPQPRNSANAIVAPMSLLAFVACLVFSY